MGLRDLSMRIGTIAMEFFPVLIQMNTALDYLLGFQGDRFGEKYRDYTHYV